MGALVTAGKVLGALVSLSGDPVVGNKVRSEGPSIIGDAVAPASVGALLEDGSPEGHELGIFGALVLGERDVGDEDVIGEIDGVLVGRCVGELVVGAFVIEVPQAAAERH